MVHLNDIHSLTSFLRDHKAHIERLRETGRPEVLTVNGKARVVVQDAEAYQKLLELLEEASADSVIRAGLDSIARGEPGIPAEKAIRELRDIINRKSHTEID